MSKTNIIATKTYIVDLWDDWDYIATDQIQSGSMNQTNSNAAWEARTLQDNPGSSKHRYMIWFYPCDCNVLMSNMVETIWLPVIDVYR